MTSDPALHLPADVDPSHPGDTRERRRGDLVLAVALLALGVLITCVRFPPADLTGWIARTLGVPLGVPFLVVALLFGASTWLLRTSRHRVLRALTLIAAIVSVVIGVTTIATFV